MPRKKIHVRDHDRRKPYQEAHIHVDDYSRAQDVRAGPPPGAAELGPFNPEMMCTRCERETECHAYDIRGRTHWLCNDCARKLGLEKSVTVSMTGSPTDYPGWKHRGMKLLTQEDRKRLPKLYATEKLPIEDKVLQVKFFTPTSNWTWYATEFDGEDTFFGYVEGFENEWGYFSLKELSDAKGPMGVGIERDKYWKPTKFGDYIAQKS